MYGRLSRWEEGDPIAESLSFSSFSQHIDDYWGTSKERPYKILLLPGYTVPEGLDRGSKDAMWIERDIEKPTAVWDGFSAPVLFEIIQECFDPEGSSPFVKVYCVPERRFVKDPRGDRARALRPVRPKGLSLTEIQHRVCDLMCWSDLIEDIGARQDIKAAYAGLVQPGLNPIGRDADIRDTAARDIIPRRGAAGYNLAAKTGEKPKNLPSLKRGPRPTENAIEQSRKEAKIQVGYSSDTELEALDLTDFEGKTITPGVFFRTSVEKWIERNPARAMREGKVSNPASSRHEIKERTSVPSEAEEAPARGSLLSRIMRGR